MSRLGSLLARVAALFRGSRAASELDSEIEAHLDLLVRENLARGMTPAEARYAARREFGGIEQTREACRDQRGIPFLETLLRDLRFALRGLVKSPGFALVALLTLALGIGTSSAVFSVVDRILFRSLPYPEDRRLVSFGVLAPFDSREFMLGPDYVDWRQRQTPFEAVTAVEPGSAECDLTERNPAHLSCGQVDSAFLPALGVPLLLGRNFAADEDRPEGPQAALLSFGLWRSRFAGDRGIVGRTIALDGRSALVVGVLPADFEMPTLARVDLLTPLRLDVSAGRGPDAAQRFLRTFARLKPGVSVSQARAMLEPLFAESLEHVPPQFRRDVSLEVRSLRDRQVGDSRLASWILVGAVLAVFLVASTNVANLVLARSSARRHELAVRAALGASRGRLVRQSLTESLVLAALGGIAGSWLAYVLLRFFVSIAPDGIPHLGQAGVDSRVLAFTVCVSAAAGVAFGLAAALRPPQAEFLGGKATRATRRSLVRQTLVTAQIAVSLVLLSSAGLLLRTLANLASVPLGMETESVLTAKIHLAEYRYPRAAEQLAFFRELESRLAGIPGVDRLAISDTLPPAGGSQATFLSAIEIPGRAGREEGTGGMIGYRYVTPGYFPALGVAILHGRGFHEEDRQSGDYPVVLSESLAARLFGREDPLGKSFRFGRQDRWRTIVGVAADVKNDGLTAAASPEFYLPWRAEPEGYFRTAHVVLRTRLNQETVARWVRSETAAMDPTLPVTIETMSQRVSKLRDGPRFHAVLLSLFAATGMLLAAIGIYGVVAFLVTQQTHEIGVRMALGATPRGILKMILLDVARWTAAGTVVGVAGAWLSSRLLESLLFAVRAHDPLLLSAATVVLLAVAFVAAWIPARRAMRVDPVVALRYE